MGMTIDKAIRDLQNSINIGLSPSIESRDVAIDTMRKYQKIQEIINNTEYIEEDVIRYKMICGVVGDGDDC